MNPGIILTPAFFATTLDSILSPIAIIASFGEPINVIPFFFNFVANSAFSERKPYPGWTACAPVFSKKLKNKFFFEIRDWPCYIVYMIYGLYDIWSI